MKKIFILTLAVLLFAGCGEKKEEPKEENKKDEYQSILERKEYNSIELDKINSITVIRYTVAGDERKEVTDQEEIKQLYNGLKLSKVGEEVSMSCEDNTTVYKFNLNNGNSYSIEIECDWFVINGKRYSIVN